MIQFVSTPVGRLHVTVCGNGPAMMLWPSLFMDAGMYREQFAYFSERYTMVAIDGPGHGGSGGRAHGDMSIEICAQAAAQVVDFLKLGPVVFVGSSWGGLVGTRLAAGHPGLVARLIVTGAPFDEPNRPDRLRSRVLAVGFRVLGGTSVFQQRIRANLFSPDFLRNEPGVVNAVTYSLRTADRAVMARVIQSVMADRGSMNEAVGRVQCPTLVLAGKQDRMVLPDDALTHSRSFARGSFEMLPGCGHLAALEGGAAFNRSIDGFLQQLPRPDEAPGKVQDRSHSPRLPSLFGKDTALFAAAILLIAAIGSGVLVLWAHPNRGSQAGVVAASADFAEHAESRS